MANLAVLSGPEQRQAQATGVATAATPMDLPLITEATSDYYRNIYADPDLGPIFKGVNMVVLRQHVSYFLHQLAMFDAPLTPRQLDYLRRVHVPVIMAHRVTQKHYDAMVGYLMKAMVANGAEGDHLRQVQVKLNPLRDLFPPVDGVDGVVLLDQTQEGTIAVNGFPQGLGPLPVAAAEQQVMKQKDKIQHLGQQHPKQSRQETLHETDFPQGPQKLQMDLSAQGHRPANDRSTSWLRCLIRSLGCSTHQ